MQSDPKFSERGRGVNYIDARKKRFWNAVLACILLRKNWNDVLMHYVTKNTPVCVCVVTFTCAEFDVMIHKETEVDYSSVLFSFTISDILLNWSALLLCIHECQVQILVQRPVLLAVV
jgi:hypothetical protein